MITPGIWTWWTSNSWTRLRSSDDSRTHDVLMPVKLCDGQLHIDVTPDDMALIKAAKPMLAALEAISSNPHLDLGDIIYTVREHEGQGWDGPAVKAWSDAVTAVKAAIALARKVER